MRESEGISGSGRRAEDLFRDATGADELTGRAGDALFDGVPIEVKKASANTVNQVRTVKYIPIVILDARDSIWAWYVAPPHEVVRLVALKARDQHTENPFECATLSMTKLDRFGVDDPDDLSSRVEQAIASGDDHPDLKAAMAQVLRECEELAARSRRLVEDAL